MVNFGPLVDIVFVGLLHWSLMGIPPTFLRPEQHRAYYRLFGISLHIFANSSLANSDQIHADTFIQAFSMFGQWVIDHNWPGDGSCQFTSVAYLQQQELGPS